jgi:ATP-dependent DNA helicase RecG
MHAPTRSPLDEPAQFLKGVGPRRAETLGKLGIRTTRDLLYHIPRRYEDASTVTRIKDLRIGTDATVIGEVTATHVLKARTGLRIFQALLHDGSGRLECAWPGQPFLDRTIRQGDMLLVTGPVRSFRGVQMQPREWVQLGRAGDAQESGKVLPIYPATEGLSQKVLRGILEQNLDRLLPLLAAEEVFPPQQLAGAGLPTLMQSLTALHRPTSVQEAERGRRRLAYEELFFLQLLHARAKRRVRAAFAGIAFTRTNTLIDPLYRSLPFRLTDAQTRAIAEIIADMKTGERMNRLLQGDVGSGKTVVALFAMALAAESGYQSALMAPTEILAEQHARTLDRLVEGTPLQVVLLTGRLATAERRQALERIATGAAQLIVGTHALIQDAVTFHRLGLAVIDEQHRFGVRQRLALAERAVRTEDGTTAYPHVLVMSATPIPRSLALTVHGDLELSVLDEVPPNRTPVHTSLRREDERDVVYSFIHDEVEAGRQAYIVYPLVEESEKVDLLSATSEYERLAGNVFDGLRVGLLHGQLAGEEKDATMRRFADGEIDILVATTVIEVGIDVANATVMLVEHAERFGLSQLHQLRGRVGRGAAQSHCMLIAPGEPEAIERLRVLCRTDDGFEIARADLRIRGMGDFFGARQHGLPELRFFDPERDDELVMRARHDAAEFLAADPELESHTGQRLKSALVGRYAEREKLYEVG